MTDVEQFVAAAPSPVLEKMARPLLDALRGSVSKWEARAAVVFYGKPSQAEAAELENYFAASPTLLGSFENEKTGASESLSIGGQRLEVQSFFWEKLTTPVQPQAVVAFVFENEKNNPFLASHFAAHFAHVSGIVFYSPADWAKAAKQNTALTELAASCQFFSFEKLPEKNLLSDLERLFDPKIKFALGGFSAVSALESIAAQIHERIQYMETQFKNAKTLNQQNLAVFQRNGGGSFGTSMHTELKNAVAKRQERFDKQFIERVDERFSAGQGELSLASEAQIDRLKELKEVKQATKTVFRVPEAFTENLLENYKKRCSELFREDLDLAKQAIKVVEKEIETYLAERKLTHPAFAHALPDGERIDRMLDVQVRFDRTHEGSIANKKLMQYFMEARMYFMLAMMVFATFGISSQVRKQKAIFLPATILLLGFGVYSAWTKRQKEVEENNAANLKSAQDSLKNELRRVQQELSRSWQKTLGDAVKEAVTSMRDEAERLLAVADAKSKTQSDQEKRQIDSIEKEFRSEESWLPRALEGRWREKIFMEKKALAKEISRHFGA